MKPLDMKEIAIIDAFPVYDHKKIILNVGCGEAKLDYHLASMGYRIYATDAIEPKYEKAPHNLTFHYSDIYTPSSFPIHSSPIVICSQVLEHLKDYKLALTNLITLTSVRLIITFPHRKSFCMHGHRNFWNDSPSKKFKDVHEFIELCKPYSVSISKIRTKPEDRNGNYDYLVVVDKRQDLINPDWTEGSR